MSKSARDRGVSLVELLVVLGIIAIMAAVAVPASNVFRRPNPTDLGARAVFTALRAAQVYSVTHNVGCAVAFNMRIVVDSRTGERIRVLDATTLARELKREELLFAGIPIPRRRAGEPPIYVPLGSDEGQWNFLPSNTCILNEDFELGEVRVQAVDPATGELITAIDEKTGEEQVLYTTITDLTSSTGMRRIRIINDEWPRLMESTDDFEDDRLDAVFRNRLPCYTFDPGGGLDVSPNYVKQRVTLNIGILPDEDVEDRFMMDKQTGDPERDEDGELIQRITRVDVYTATGRVKISD